MKYEWKIQPECYKASIPVDFPAEAVIYVAYDTMAVYSPEPYIKDYQEAFKETSSCDVIVCGTKDSGYLLAGAVTCFRSISLFSARRTNRRITEISVCQPYIRPEEKPEEIVTLEGNDWRELLFRYADLAAKKMGVKPIKAEKNMTGYCTWYYYYKDVTQQHLLENVEALKKNRSPFAAEYVQIDDGYQTLQGDWLDRHQNWPTPLDETARRITEGGMKAGIWTMPFTASTASKVFHEHPDWFVKDGNGNPVTLQGWSPPPDDKWLCLDTTRDDVCEHLANVFKTFREMGYTYFKMDGLIYGLQAGKRQDPDATPVSAFRKGLQAIRNAVPDSILMACSEPFMPCLGLVDNARLSNDTSRYFNGPGPKNAPQMTNDINVSMHVSLANFWKFDRWFRCDPDVLMTRQDNAFYTEGEAKISVLTGIMTGVCFTSDHLGTIAPERLAYLGKAQNIRMRGVQPFHEVPQQWPMLFEGTVNGYRAVAVINDSPEKIEYKFSELGLPENCTDLLTDKKYSGSIQAEPHDGYLLM